MLDQGVIEPCKSPWSSIIIIIKKPEDKGGGYRFVNDYREINKLTKNWAYHWSVTTLDHWQDIQSSLH